VFGVADPERSPKAMQLPRFPPVLCCVLAAGCVSHEATKKPDRWEEAAMRTGIPKEEVVQLATSAADKHKLCAVTVFKEEDGRIGVLLATAISDTGGVIIYFRHSAAGWIEDDTEIGTWDEKRRANLEGCVRPERSGAVNTTIVEQARGELETKPQSAKD